MAEPLEPTDGELGQRLFAERPVPRAGFRAELRKALREGDPASAMPPRLKLVVVAYAISGAILLTVAGVGLAGVGPFAA